MSGIRNLILSLKSPVVFHGKISEWDMLKWDEEKWCDLFGNKPVPFRCGLKKCTRNPQWEWTCRTEHITMSEFFKNAKEGSEDLWQYFDYKYLNEWLKGSEAFETMSWANLGFPELSKDDCTLWIGSSGAHTPCHIDSYGCNLVAQIRGHKQWILFPPHESAKLEMTRVPYEESSVYSALNFNAPIADISNSLEEVYIVTLSPGDVLFVPHHWWHYVENLDTAIAINTWLILPQDDDCRLDEALVRFLISQATSGISSAHWSEIINPNEDSLSNTDLSSTMIQLKVCLANVLKASNSCKNSEKESLKRKEILDLPETLTEYCNEHQHGKSKKPKWSPSDYQDLSNCSASDNMIQGDFKVIPKCNTSVLKNILDAKCKCASKEEHASVMKPIQDTDDIMELLPAVINAFCHPDVIKIVKSILLQQTRKDR